jgi:hypothetical protein
VQIVKEKKKFNFHFGRKDITAKQWLKYSLVTASLAALLSHCGTQVLQSRHGDWVRDGLCAVSLKLPDGVWSRLLHALCEASKDGVITENEARVALDRASQATGESSEYFNRDPANLERRASAEVSYAIDRWKAANPPPQIDPELRRQLPNLSKAQLCVLSQAERYEDGGAIGIRYAGMDVCE